MVLSSAKSPHRYRLTADDYHRMGEAGIFAEEDRVELIEGKIIEMAPIGCSHSGVVLQLSEMVRDAVGRKALVSVQNPIAIGPHSEPQPDIALLKRREDYYKSAHPLPADVLLIIEVADTSLAYDRDVKLPLYARHGIPEVWIVDIENRCLHVFTGPAETGYRQTHALADPAVRTLGALPECSIDLSGLF